MATKTAALVFPHQLYRPHPAVSAHDLVYLVEEPLLFTQYNFHRKKLILHRATMTEFADELKKSGKECRYLDTQSLSTSSSFAAKLRLDKIKKVTFIDPCDDWLMSRICVGLDSEGIEKELVPDPGFLTSDTEIANFTAGERKLFFHSFYIQQRTRHEILLDGKKPLGGRWSFDSENRKRLPAKAIIPERWKPTERNSVLEARKYVKDVFPQAIGNDLDFEYPVVRADARKLFQHFLETHFENFGPYEDAVSSRDGSLHHSVLTPCLNIGLLTPTEVLKKALSADDSVSLASREGFVRQILGWREFMRVSYLVYGRRQRSKNFWKHTKAIPKAFYEGSSGIVPVDTTIKKVLNTGYCHHIERLMVLGAFFLLCEIDPDEIYRWFMELFVDAYDWVMVPNVYGMSQHSDGGLITTKPYICGSNYILKMSDYPRGPWCEVWDALYWRFVDKHKEFFLANPRLSVTVRNLGKDPQKLQNHHRVAERFLNQLYG